MFKSIKRYYNKEIYTLEHLKVFVKAKWITKEQYTEITGKYYEAT